MNIISDIIKLKDDTSKLCSYLKALPTYSLEKPDFEKLSEDNLLLFLVLVNNNLKSNLLSIILDKKFQQV